VLGRLDLALGDVEACEVGTLRKSTSGKLSRSANRALYLERVAARQAGTPGPAAAAAEPRDLWERQLAWIWEELIGRGPIGVDDALYLEWGVDSVTAARAAAAIADRLGVRVDATALLQAESIASQAAVLRRAADGRAAGGERSALITLQPAGAGTDLFLVHAAGGWAFPYVTLARALGRERPVHAFQMPHLTREAGEAPLSALTVPGLAARYLEALRAQRPRGPYLLGGWSFGGLVAIELALRLAAAGEQVERVVLFDTEPPPSAIGRAKDRVTRPVMGAAFRQALHRPWLRRAVPGIGGLDRLSPVWRFFVSFLMTGEEQRIAPLLAWAFGDRADPARLAALAGRGPDDAWAYAVELARGSEAPADRSLLIPGLDGPGARRALRVARRLEVMRHRYRPTQRYQGRVDIIAVAGNAALERWRQAVSGPVQIHPFPLERKYVHPHWDLMEPENVARFAPALQRLLAGQGA
jgi:thioesterase domain-containing protein